MNGLRGFVAETRADVAGLPLSLRVGLWSAVVCGLLGGVCGLLIGLWAYPPTAWFAVVELGLPSAIVGGVLGLVGGAIAQTARRG